MLFTRTHEQEAPTPPSGPTAAEVQAAEEIRAAQQAQAREGARPARERVAEMVQRREAAEAAQREHVAEFAQQQAAADYARRQRDGEMKATAQRAWGERQAELQRKVDELRTQFSTTQGQADSCYGAGDLDAAARFGALSPTIQRALAQAEAEAEAHLRQAPAFYR